MTALWMWDEIEQPNLERLRFFYGGLGNSHMQTAAYAEACERQQQMMNEFYSRSRPTLFGWLFGGLLG